MMIAPTGKVLWLRNGSFACACGSRGYMRSTYPGTTLVHSEVQACTLLVCLPAGLASPSCCQYSSVCQLIQIIICWPNSALRSSLSRQG